jgi:integrase/recombinase XerD
MKKYSFSTDIEKQLLGFEQYLRKKKYAIDTIRQTRNYAGVYLEWLEEEGLEARDVKYNEFADFIFQMKNKKTLYLTRRIILATRHYYRHLDIDNNPASGIYIRGSKRSVLNNLVPYAQLLKLYENHQTLDDRDKRNKVILGLLVYQALTTGALQRLEPGHVRIKEGKIYVPGYGKSNRRTLDLEAVQSPELQEYLQVIRPRMLAEVNTLRPGRKPQEGKALIRQRLFFSENGSENIKGSLLHLFRAIRKSYPKITSGKVIRSTVIAHWLKSKDLRIVQYMAGHRYVSSTEKYNVYNLQELKESLRKYHPLRRMVRRNFEKINNIN